MAPLDIRFYDDPVLRETAAPIEAVEERHRQLAAGMAETMYAARGIGLAANQVGLTERIIVVDVDWPATEDEDHSPVFKPLTLINPEVLDESDVNEAYSEGCLSLPEIEGEVWRPIWIRYRYLDLNGETREEEATGLRARCILHEIDHLDGVLFIDHLVREDREKLAGKLAGLRRSRKP